MMASILLMMFGFIAFYIRFFAWHNGGMVHIQGWTDQFSGFSGNIIVLPIWYVPYWLSTSTFFYPRCLELGKNILEDNWLKILLSICVLPFQIASWILNFQDGSLRLFLSYSANFDWKSLPQNLLEVDTIGPCKRSFWEVPIPSTRPWCDRKLDADWAIGRFGENGHAARADGGKGAVFFIQDLFAWIL